MIHKTYKRFHVCHCCFELVTKCCQTRVKFPWSNIYRNVSFPADQNITSSKVQDAILNLVAFDILFFDPKRACVHNIFFLLCPQNWSIIYQLLITIWHGLIIKKYCLPRTCRSGLITLLVYRTCCRSCFSNKCFDPVLS